MKFEELSTRGKKPQKELQAEDFAFWVMMDANGCGTDSGNNDELIRLQVELSEYKDRIDEEILEKKKKEIEERIYLLKLKYDRLIYMQEEIKNKKSYTRVNETEQEKVLRRKYEKRNVGKSA